MKFRLMIVEICIVFVLVALAQGQFKYALTEQQKDVQLTGFLQHDLALNAGGDLLVDSASVKRTVIKKVRYSPLTAGLLSAVSRGTIAWPSRSTATSPLTTSSGRFNSSRDCRVVKRNTARS